MVVTLDIESIRTVTNSTIYSGELFRIFRCLTSDGFCPQTNFLDSSFPHIDKNRQAVRSQVNRGSPLLFSFTMRLTNILVPRRVLSTSLLYEHFFIFKRENQPRHTATKGENNGGNVVTNVTRATSRVAHDKPKGNVCRIHMFALTKQEFFGRGLSVSDPGRTTV